MPKGDFNQWYPQNHWIHAIWQRDQEHDINRCRRFQNMLYCTQKALPSTLSLCLCLSHKSEVTSNDVIVSCIQLVGYVNCYGGWQILSSADLSSFNALQVNISTLNCVWKLYLESVEMLPYWCDDLTAPCPLRKWNCPVASRTLAAPIPHVSLQNLI